MKYSITDKKESITSASRGIMTILHDNSKMPTYFMATMKSWMNITAKALFDDSSIVSYLWATLIKLFLQHLLSNAKFLKDWEVFHPVSQKEFFQLMHLSGNNFV